MGIQRIAAALDARRIPRTVKAAGVLVGAGVLVMSTGFSAQAALYEAEPSVKGTGVVQFESVGDVFTICDEKADGYGIAYTITRTLASGSGSAGTFYYRGGAYNCEDWNTDEKEGTEVTIQVCLEDTVGSDTRVFDCGATVHATA